jgi:hypothetical protein
MLLLLLLVVVVVAVAVAVGCSSPLKEPGKTYQLYGGVLLLVRLAVPSGSW